MLTISVFQVYPFHNYITNSTHQIPNSHELTPFPPLCSATNLYTHLTSRTNCKPFNNILDIL
jgi:hypothetical protein